jgi:hypothetical protein
VFAKKIENMIKNLLIVLCLSVTFIADAQDDLLSMADSLTEGSTATKYVSGTFKGTRVINGHSIETPAAGDLHFLISHRFGTVNKGIYEFFGLDNATIRLGLEYGITKDLTVGYGRSSLQKTYDLFLKYKLLKQREDNRIPVSVTLFTSGAMTTLRFTEAEKEYRNENSRFSYTYQLLLARKFSSRLSLQLMPTLIHRNFVETMKDENDVYSVGIAGRFKISKRVAVTSEYYYLVSQHTADQFKNALSFGFDIETGGHVFQLHLTNAQGMIEKFYIPQTNSSWSKKEIYFGFNISRVFTLTDKEGKKKKGY